MGAADQGGVLKGSTESEALANLQAAIDLSRVQDGNSYSGAIGMVDGIKRVRKHFASVALAYEWLEENAEKFGPALVVTASRFIAEDDVAAHQAAVLKELRAPGSGFPIATPSDGESEKVFVFGALCSE